MEVEVELVQNAKIMDPEQIHNNFKSEFLNLVVVQRLDLTDAKYQCARFKIGSFNLIIFKSTKVVGQGVYPKHVPDFITKVNSCLTVSILIISLYN